MTSSDVFRRIISALEDAGIAHMLAGSFASSYHGSARATQDINLVIEADARRLVALVQLLPPSAYYVDEGAALEALQAETQFNVVDLSAGWTIDLIIRRSRSFSVEEFTRRNMTDYEGTRLAIATAEDLIIVKLERAKTGDLKRRIEDVVAMLRVRGEELDRDYIQRWVTALDVDAQWVEARRLAEA